MPTSVSRAGTTASSYLWVSQKPLSLTEEQYACANGALHFPVSLIPIQLSPVGLLPSQVTCLPPEARTHQSQQHPQTLCVATAGAMAWDSAGAAADRALLHSAVCDIKPGKGLR